MPATCRGPHCQAEIDFAVKADGTGRLPITRPAPCPGPGPACTHAGPLAVQRDGSRLVYRHAGPAGPLGPREHRAMPHHAECPDAAAFRSRGHAGG